jgi:hypothetical protein
VDPRGERTASTLKGGDLFAFEMTKSTSRLPLHTAQPYLPLVLQAKQCRRITRRAC